VTYSVTNYFPFGVGCIPFSYYFAAEKLCETKIRKMSRLLEDLLCGAVGYGFGKRNREFTQEEVESLIRSYLKGVPLEAVIGHWMEANDYGMSSPIIAHRLREKADEIEM
jgi:hypothetical protein